MSSHSRSVEVPLPEAQDLADLYSRRFDLGRAAEYCRHVLEQSPAGRTLDHSVQDALIAAAVIRYGRVFHSGVRPRWLRRDIQELPSEVIELHDNFMALRDKFVAHPVNGFEEIFVTVTASERDGVLQPITAVHAGLHFVMLAEKQAHELLALVDAVSTIVNDRIAIEEQKLLSLIRSLPLDVAHGWDLHSPAALLAARVDKPRKTRRK